MSALFLKTVLLASVAFARDMSKADAALIGQMEALADIQDGALLAAQAVSDAQKERLHALGSGMLEQQEETRKHIITAQLVAGSIKAGSAEAEIYVDNFDQISAAEMAEATAMANMVVTGYVGKHQNDLKEEELQTMLAAQDELYNLGVSNSQSELEYQAQLAEATSALQLSAANELLDLSTEHNEEMLKIQSEHFEQMVELEKYQNEQDKLQEQANNQQTLIMTQMLTQSDDKKNSYYSDVQYRAEQELLKAEQDNIALMNYNVNLSKQKEREQQQADAEAAMLAAAGVTPAGAYPPQQQAYNPYAAPQQQAYNPYAAPQQQAYNPYAAPQQQAYNPYAAPQQQAYNPYAAPQQQAYDPYAAPQQQAYDPYAAPQQQAYNPYAAQQQQVYAPAAAQGAAPVPTNPNVKVIDMSERGGFTGRRLMLRGLRF